MGPGAGDRRADLGAVWVPIARRAEGRVGLLQGIGDAALDSLLQGQQIYENVDLCLAPSAVACCALSTNCRDLPISWL